MHLLHATLASALMTITTQLYWSAALPQCNAKKILTHNNNIIADIYKVIYTAFYILVIAQTYIKNIGVKKLCFKHSNVLL